MEEFDSRHLHGSHPEEQQRLSRLNALFNAISLRAIGLGGNERILDVDLLTFYRFPKPVRKGLRNDELARELEPGIPMPHEDPGIFHHRDRGGDLALRSRGFRPVRGFASPVSDSTSTGGPVPGAHPRRKPKTRAGATDVLCGHHGQDSETAIPGSSRESPSRPHQPE